MMDLTMTSVFLLLLPIWTALVSAGVDDMWDGLNSKFNLFIFLIKTKKENTSKQHFSKEILWILIWILLWSPQLIDKVWHNINVILIL